MLSIAVKPINFATFNIEPWEDYSVRLALPNNRPEREFYRQVVYDHFDHFNHHYPDLKLDDYKVSIVNLTAKEVDERVRYFNNERVNFWSKQFDHYLEADQDYIVFQRMKKDGTPPFPPILIDSSKLVDGAWIYGRPLHLIEGTHRTSYLIRMAELDIIEWKSIHEFVLLSPR